VRATLRVLPLLAVREEDHVGKNGKRRERKKKREKEKRKEKIEKLLNLEILGEKVKDNL
jgi:hypothetical protein